MICGDWQSKINKNGDPTLGLNYAQNEVFHNLLAFGSSVFLEIAYSDSFEQCLTSSRVKTFGKSFGGPIWPKRAKITLAIRFFAIWFRLVY